MTDRVDIPSLERITFFTGQQLLATDLTELWRVNRELSWLHNRSLHSWGIGIGFGVAGERGDSTVTVNPGYGVDCLGREVILTEPRTRTVPGVSGTEGGGQPSYYLVAAYQEDAAQNVTEHRPGVCLPEGTVRLGEEPLLVWRLPTDLREGMELILAQAWIQSCRLSRPLSFAARRYARASSQPYIAAGQTPAGKTGWALWSVGGQKVGISADVETSAARFRTTPRYVAHVVGDRFLDGPPGPLLALGVPAVVNATPLSFTLRVMLPDLPPVGVDINPAVVRQQPGLLDQMGWHVVWMGIEA